MDFEEFRQGIIESDMQVTEETHDDDVGDMGVFNIEMVNLYESDRAAEVGMSCFYDAMDLDGAEDWSEVDSGEVEEYLTELSNYEGSLNMDQKNLAGDLNRNGAGPEDYVEEWKEKGLFD